MASDYIQEIYSAFLRHVLHTNHLFGQTWYIDEQAEKLHAALQYVLRAEALGDTGTMSADVFVELMDMMVPRLDPMRRAGGGAGEAGAGHGEGQG